MRHDIGRPWPLGADLRDGGCNFAVWAPNASQVLLCLFDEQDNETQIPLTNRQSGIYYGFIYGIHGEQKYGFRADGRFDPERGWWFNPNKLMVDPYSQAVDRPFAFDEAMYGHKKLDGKITRDTTNSGDVMPKSKVVDHGFDWQGQTRLHHRWQDTIIYEAHVKGMTMQHPDVPEHLRGTYLGMAEPVIVEYLRALGITAVQLLPVQTFMSEPRLKDLKLSNYWGYNPICFSSPDPRYAYQDAVTEFKTLVRAYHQAGIEVIMDVVFNHTSEAGFDGPYLSHRGLHGRDYYRVVPNNPGHYIDHSGCGNSVNSHHGYVLREILDSLRTWVHEYRVDGFRFDLAASLGREPLDYRRDAAFFRCLEQDPILSQVKLIAEPWDIGPGGYQVGNFPDRWFECNDRFRDTMRSFWKGDNGKLADFCTRVMGSRDLFYSDLNQLTRTLNYVTYHDGFTLNDLVSYNDRHNQANLERNMDGHGNNLSYNYGVEGPTEQLDINLLRRRQQRNMLATLMLSQGAVHMLGGDERLRSQKGNNNAYCQDNEISWLNWKDTPEVKRHVNYIRQLTCIRQSSTLFHDLQFTAHQLLNGPAHSDKAHWFNSHGNPMEISDWHDSGRKLITLLLTSGTKNPKAGLAQLSEYFLVMINAHSTPHTITLPVQQDCPWEQVFDTAHNHGILDTKQTSVGCPTTLHLAAHSVVLWAKSGWMQDVGLLDDDEALLCVD